MTKQTTFTPGQQLVFNGGFVGTFVRYHSEGMIEVRHANSIVCVPATAANAFIGNH